MLFILFLGALGFFYHSLIVYFVQDDFLLLKLSQISRPADFLAFFVPFAQNVWYRPLSTEVFFFFGRTLFGLSPLPWHIVVLLTHVATAYLLMKVTENITQNKNITRLTAVIYTFHQLHTVSLSWLATYSFILGPLWLILTLYFYIKRKPTLSFLAAFAGVLTTEVLIIIPLVLALYQRTIERRIRLTLLIPSGVMSAIVLWLRFLVFPAQQTSELYQIAVNGSSVGVLKFYLLRLLGFPLAIDAMPGLTKIIAYVLGVLFVLVILLDSYLTIKARAKLSPVLTFFIGTFILGLMPFLLLPAHVAPYYLSFALLGAAPLFAYAMLSGSNSLSNKKIKWYFIGTMLVYLVLQYVGTTWTYNSHWIFHRAILAKNLVAQRQLIQPVGSEGYFALGADSAAKYFGQ